MPRRSKFLVGPMMSGLPVRIVYQALSSRLASTSGAKGEWRLLVGIDSIVEAGRTAALAPRRSRLRIWSARLGTCEGCLGVAVRAEWLRRMQPLALQPWPRALSPRGLLAEAGVQTARVRIVKSYWWELSDDSIRSNPVAKPDQPVVTRYSGIASM